MKLFLGLRHTVHQLFAPQTMTATPEHQQGGTRMSLSSYNKFCIANTACGNCEPIMEPQRVNA
jgi:hypothetical protein